MKAVVLAAGEGQRLRPLTNDRPKCLVELGGRPLLDQQLASLKRAGIKDISLVTGFRADRLSSYGLPAFHNPDFASTNMVTSLMAARSIFNGDADVLICYSDILYEPRVLECLFPLDQPVTIPVNTAWESLWSLRFGDPLIDAETLKTNKNGHLLEIGKKPTGKESIQAQYMGLIAVRKDFAQKFISLYDSLSPAQLFEGRPKATMFMTAYLQLLVDSGVTVMTKKVDGGWLEVDTLKELQLYESLHSSGKLSPYFTSVE